MALIKPEQLRSGSYQITGSLFGTSSFALTASYALNVGDSFRILTGSVIASTNVGPTIFSLISGSSTFLTVDNQGKTTISSSADDIFLVKNINNTPVLTVSQSGVIVLSTQSIELSNPAPNGGMYFTSNSFFVGLD